MVKTRSQLDFEYESSTALTKYSLCIKKDFQMKIKLFEINYFFLEFRRIEDGRMANGKYWMLINSMKGKVYSNLKVTHFEVIRHETS